MTTMPALYAATPTVSIAHADHPQLSAFLDDLVVEETIEGLVTCEARFQNVGADGTDPTFQFFDRTVLDFGTSLGISAGGGDGAGEIFSGRITGIRGEFAQHGSAMITVLAEDRLQDLRMTRRTRTFEDITDAAAFERIAADHRLRPDIDLPGPTHRVIAQLDQSDLAFVRSRARRAGAEVWVDDGVLHVARRVSRRSERVVLSNRQNLREASISADLAGQRTSWTVGGWDPGAKQAIVVSADRTCLGSERVGGTSGAEALSRAFGQRPERSAHAVPLGTDEAKAVAEAQFLAMARRFVSGEVIADGDARLRVGTRVELVGIGPWFSGEYDVVGTQHLFDLDRGYRTHIRVERAEVML